MMSLAKPQKGSVLVFSLIVLAIVLSTALSITAVNVSNRKSAASTAQSVQSFQTADTATEKVMKAVYNGNYASVTALYAALKATPDPNAVPPIPDSTCPGVLNLAVAGGMARVNFLDTNGVALTEADCTSTLWRDTLARVKVEGSGSSGSGAVRVIEVGIAPLSSMAWGANGQGQLGDGTTGTDRTSPVSTIGGNKWKSVSAGDSHVLAVRADGTLWTWGNGANGRLGRGSNADASSPIQVGTDNTWESVSAGGSHSLGIKINGTNHELWAWGNGNSFRLGTGNSNSQDVPVRIGVDNCNPSPCPAGWKVVSAGSDFSLAIGTDDTLWSWGNNADGRLGNAENGHTPGKISSCSSSCAAGWKAISAGTDHTLAIDGDDNLWAWGARHDGQIGDGGATSGRQDNPIKIPGSDTWISIASGENHSLGIKSDHSLWSWGKNDYGQLGGSIVSGSYNTPQSAGSAAAMWQSVFAGDSHSLGIWSGGLWVWGRNNRGQIGNGSTGATASGNILGNWQTAEAGSAFSIGVRQ